MALGGGAFLVQNKVLPGSYINFISAAKASATLSERGVATLPLPLDWGPEGEIFTVTNEAFQKDSMKWFGYPYAHENLRPLRELFQNIREGHFFRLNSGGQKAKNSLAEARYPGARGNAVSLVVEANESSTEAAPLYDVVTLLDGVAVDEQKGVVGTEELRDNDYVRFLPGAALTLSAGAPLAGGTNGETQDAAYQTYLDKLESYSFHTLGCTSTNPTVKGLFAAFTKRMRDENGVKFQCVLFRYEKADYEGVISVENGLVGDENNPALVYWITGAEAGCAVSRSLTNARYTGEYDVLADYTQEALKAGIAAGKLMLHKVGEEIRVLTDINTFVSVTDEKSADFASNQTMRVLDQIGNDIAALFNTKYLGKAPNDNAGRIALWNDIVKHHQELQTIRAIENFTGENVKVAQGETKKAVVVEDHVTPVNAMAQLYMTVIVE